MVMRRLLGSVLPTLLLVAALGACGDEEGGTASDDPTRPSRPRRPVADGVRFAHGARFAHGVRPAPGGPTDDEVDFELVKMLTETAAGGATSEVAVPLGDDAAVQQFNAQFETDPLPTRVQNAVAETDVPDGMLLYGAVVADRLRLAHDVLSSKGDVRAGRSPRHKVPTPHRVLRADDHRRAGAGPGRCRR